MAFFPEFMHLTPEYVELLLSEIILSLFSIHFKRSIYYIGLLNLLLKWIDSSTCNACLHIYVFYQKMITVKIMKTEKTEVKWPGD